MTESDENEVHALGFQISTVSVEGTELRIVCRGHWGFGSQGNDSGRLVQEVIAQKLDDPELQITSIILDYQHVFYEWGDGVIWSVQLALCKGIDVTFYGNLQNAGSLQSAIRDLAAWTEHVRLRVKSDRLT